jgi:predicted MPP superfamily phosphohydrolase
VKILVLSDIHNNHLALDSLLELAKKNAPDYICLAGDTLDQADADTEEIVSWLESVSQIAKVVIGLGNHELMARSRRFRRSHGENVDFYVAVAKIKNCVLLKDRFCVYNASKQLTFSALNMQRSWYVSGEPKAEFKEVLKNIPPKALDGSRFNILLSHSPNGWQRGSKL